MYRVGLTTERGARMTGRGKWVERGDA